MEVIWTPAPEVVERANVTRLMRTLGVEEYRELVRRSQEDPDRFWRAAVADLGIEFSTPFRRVLDSSRGLEWTAWFTGGRLSLAWNCVHRHAEGAHGERPAAIFAGEDGERRVLTYRELSEQVTRLAEALVRLGVRPGDRVACFLPLSPEAVAVTHACAHVGAILVPVFSGFAAPAVAERLRDAEARVLVTADGSLRRGRTLPMKEVADEAARQAPSLEHMLVWPRLGRGDVPLTAGRDRLWEDELAASPGTLEPLEVDSEHPFLLVYTSGTTGRPKGVVHVQGGFLVSVAREIHYHADVGQDDVVHYVTDLGWIMGPWTVVGGNAVGATLVLSEGSPDWPIDRLWRLTADERVSVLGVAPTLVRSLASHGDEPVRAHDRSTLRIFVTSGEPWNPEPYRWLHRVVGDERAPIINISGGTEVGACFLAPAPVVPTKTCSLGGPVLGMAVDVVDDRGVSVPPGTVGELVCRKPFPGMTRGFWRDPDRYVETYWRRFPGMWVHGDWASVDADGYWYLHGRSDDTLSVAGKRLGPAELESAAVAHPAVAEAAAVGVPDDVKGESAWLVCVPAPGVEPDGELAAAVADLVAVELGKAFRPARVVFVPELPKTRSAKVVRRAVRAAALGADPGDLSAVENPGALRAITAAVRSPGPV